MHVLAHVTFVFTLVATSGTQKLAPRPTFEPVAESSSYDPPVPHLVDFGSAVSVGVDPEGRRWIVVEARDDATHAVWLCVYWGDSGKFFRALPAARAKHFPNAATSFDARRVDLPPPNWLTQAARSALGAAQPNRGDECRVARLRHDVDGDGCEDLAAALWDGETKVERVELRSGADGHVLRSASLHATEHAGFAIDAGRDVDGDGIGDIVVGRPNLYASAGGSRVEIFSGTDLRSLRVIEELFGGGYVEGFGASVALVRDLDGDGSADVLVGCWEDDDQGDDYYAAAFSGRTGAEIGMTRTAHHFVHVAALDTDLDADGKDEFLLALPEREEVWIVRGAAALGELDAFGHRGKHDWTPMSVLLPPKPPAPR